MKDENAKMHEFQAPTHLEMYVWHITSRFWKK